MGVPCASVHFPGHTLDLIGTYGQNGDKPIYSNLLDVLAMVLQDRIKASYQNVVVATGGTGSGKSTSLINLAYKMERDWQMSPNFIYANRDLKRKMRDLSGSPISLFDEGSVSLNSYNSQRAEDKALSILFDTMRTLGWTTLIALPRWEDLNSRVRANHVDFRIICPRKAPLMGYSARGFFHLYRKHIYELSGKIYWQFLGTGIFKPLPPRRQREYDELKRAKQLQLIEEFVNSDGDD